MTSPRGSPRGSPRYISESPRGTSPRSDKIENNNGKPSQVKFSDNVVDSAELVRKNSRIVPLETVLASVADNEDDNDDTIQNGSSDSSAKQVVHVSPSTPSTSVPIPIRTAVSFDPTSQFQMKSNVNETENEGNKCHLL